MCACYLYLYVKKLRSHLQPGPSRATISPPWDAPNGCFFIFSPAWGPPKLGFSNSHDGDAQKNCPNDILHRYLQFFHTILQSRVFWSVFACFCNVFLQNTVIYIFVAIKPFQNIMFYNVSNSLVSPNPWKHRYLHCFLQFFHVPMPLANSNIYTKNLSKHCFLRLFYNVFRQKHRKLHVFRHKVGPKHWFLQCFQCSGIQKLFKISLFTVFFHFCPFFPCRKPTKMTQNSISIPS